MNAFNKLMLGIVGLTATGGSGYYFGLSGAEASPGKTQAEKAEPVAPAAALETSNPQIFVQLSKKVIPSVVNISTLTLVKQPQFRGGPEDFFREFFEGHPGYRGMAPRRGPPPQSKPQPRAASLGTGFIVDESGIILTNNHVVQGADEIKINFTEDANEKPTSGEVIGRDEELDIALIKVKTDRKLQALPLGDSDALEVGEYVAAVGNPFGQGHSLTHGIISAKGRQAPEFPLATYLQTDAPINPGNSGGPLLNLRGEVIGINNAIDARAQGIGFAIPVNLVKKVLPQLREQGKVARGYLGVMVGEMTPELAAQLRLGADRRAPLVTEVSPDGPAFKAGVRPYDVITRVNGKDVATPAELTARVTEVPVGDEVELEVIREGKKRKLEVKVGQRPQSHEVAKR